MANSLGMLDRNDSVRIGTVIGKELLCCSNTIINKKIEFLLIDFIMKMVF
jgi:hypothetical protein